MKLTHLTPSQAAKFVGMSRPAFLKHVQAGRITANITTAGNRALFAVGDVRTFKQRRDRMKANGNKGKATK